MAGTDLFAARERGIFEALEALSQSGCEFSVIGGYAVNAYALPRFSVDCDMATSEKEAQKAAKLLLSIGFVRQLPPRGAPYVNFIRLEKEMLPRISASFDVLFNSVHDRQSGASFSAEWIFSNSSVQILPAKTFAGGVKVRVISPDALFVMKFCCARGTDIRDIFMLCDRVRDWQWVKSEIAQRLDFEKQHRRIMGKLTGTDFKKNLGGVFGYVEQKAFEKRLKIMASLAEQ